jgi:hypothetical protein
MNKKTAKLIGEYAFKINPENKAKAKRAYKKAWNLIPRNQRNKFRIEMKKRIK